MTLFGLEMSLTSIVLVLIFGAIALGAVTIVTVLGFATRRNRNTGPSAVAIGPVQPPARPWYFTAAKQVLLEWKLWASLATIAALTWLMSILLETDFSAWWTWVGENWPWLIVLVLPYLFLRGGWQNRKVRSYVGDAMYYIGGSIMVVLAIAFVVLGKDLALRALEQSQTKTRAAFECGWMDNPTIDCAAAAETLSGIDWGVLALCFLGLAFLGGLLWSKALRGTIAGLATIIIVPLLLWLAWGAVPDDFKEDLSELKTSVSETLGDVGNVIPMEILPGSADRFEENTTLANACVEREQRAGGTVGNVLGGVMAGIGLIGDSTPIKLQAGESLSIGLCADMAYTDGPKAGFIHHTAYVFGGDGVLDSQIDPAWQQVHKVARGREIQTVSYDAGQGISFDVNKWPGTTIGYIISDTCGGEACYQIVISAQLLRDYRLDGALLQLTGS